MKLVIVESPSKIKTIKQYLGKEYQILASYGHIRDLLPKANSVDPQQNFKMHYVIQEKAKKHLTEITKHLKLAEALYLATDPDREGEAIAWHLLEILKQKRLLKNIPVYRIAFHEITKNVVINAFKEPRELSMPLINAQQARRALDFLVGFNLSPLLWKKIRYGLSAGRVQSPALRMIVEREEEIKNFKQQEYWSIIAQNKFKNEIFETKLIKIDGQKIEQFSFTSKEQVDQLIAQISIADLMKVEEVTSKQKKRNPPPPFITSTLQQEASKNLGFSAKKTMSVAQKLYESGHITYMRTDSVNLSQGAIQMLRQIIQQEFGVNALPSRANQYKTKVKNAQEAHEAIRPSNPLKPGLLKVSLDQEKLYRLIWQRSLASQMLPAIFSVMTIDLSCLKKYLFRATGSSLIKPGFLEVYGEKDQETTLPVLQKNDLTKVIKIYGKQHFTEPPPRFSEATLVKTLEEHGIGRPSTYATIIDTLVTRGYVTLENKRFHPNDVGQIVNQFLVKYFNRYVDYEFTAQLENDLDEIAQNNLESTDLLKQFWQPFQELIEITNKNVSKNEIISEPITAEKCPDCGEALVVKLGKNGKFISCSAFPKCRYIAPLNNIDSNNSSIKEPLGICPKCGASLLKKYGPYGEFIGCSNYPKCKHIEQLHKPEDTKIICPKCKEGSLLKKYTRKGKIFYACSSYPKCNYALWNVPIAETCPKCNWPILTFKATKPKHRICPNEKCGYTTNE